MLLLCLPLVCGAHPVVQEIWVDTAPSPRGAERLKAAMLKSHNDARAAVGAAPMVWSDALARDAQAYAETLARHHRFEHSPMPRGNPVQGENLWMGTKTAFGYEEMANGWVDERRDFRRGRFPDVSRTGRWSDVGHYTQIIWRTTNQFGCAVAADSNDEYLVCRYRQVGNVMGFDPMTGMR